ncbi:hypothetical protein SAMN05421812_108299 [Asanoa hainanensis]|uniref:Uncharacterized protein n=1 Tax=Asanoa hainanensis TaxID=560556 RepID=A0A239NGT7_9ACTN|nr:hypothetical protein [Asanoa hainanensis]SNT53752.1 hypothetical protein SAMN05421812_108299 [Asanoa hainanensis]
MSTQVLIRVAESGADAPCVQRLTDAFVDALRAEGVAGVETVRRGDTAVGARGVDWESLGLVLATIQGSAEAILRLVTITRAWLSRDSGPRSVELSVGEATLRLSDASGDQQERLVEEFIRAVARDGREPRQPAPKQTNGAIGSA